MGFRAVMGFSAGIGRVTVIVADVLDLLEICLQDLDISIDEWAVIFFLSEIKAGMIWRPHFGWSFHGWCPFLVFVRGIWEGWIVKIDFESENGKMGSIRSGGVLRQKGTVLG